MELTLACYALTKILPASERFGLVSQINRAAVSIPANIAEGNSRMSDKDNRRFIEIALGSCNELETLIILTQRLELLPTEKTTDTLQLINEEQRLLWSFIRKLSTTEPKKLEARS